MPQKASNDHIQKKYRSLFRVRMTLLQVFLHDAAKVLSAQENSQLFTESYFEALFKRREDSGKRAIQLMIFSTTISVILFLQAVGVDFTSSLMGLNLRDVTKNKELLLLLATIVGTASGYFFMHSDVLTQVIKAGINAQQKAPIARFYGLRFDGLVESLGKTAPISADYGLASKTQRIVLAVTMTGALLQLVAFGILGLALGIYVWLNAWNYPSLDLGWNRAILIVTGLNGLFAVYLSVMLRFRKLKFVDVRKRMEFDNLRQTDQPTWLSRVKEEFERKGAKNP